MEEYRTGIYCTFLLVKFAIAISNSARFSVAISQYFTFSYRSKIMKHQKWQPVLCPSYGLQVNAQTFNVMNTFESSHLLSSSHQSKYKEHERTFTINFLVTQATKLRRMRTMKRHERRNKSCRPQSLIIEILSPHIRYFDFSPKSNLRPPYLNKVEEEVCIFSLIHFPICLSNKVSRKNRFSSNHMIAIRMNS